MKKIMLLIFTMFHLLSYSDSSYSPIYPTIVEVNIGKGKKVGEFRIFNTSDKVKTFEVGVNERDNSNEVSLIKEYIKVFPNSFSLKPGDSKVVRVMLKNFPKDMMGKGEYRAALFVKGLSSKIQNQYESKTHKGVSATVEIKIDVNMAVYVLTGNEKAQVDILSKKISGDKTILDIKNVGNYSYEVLIDVFDKKGKEKKGEYPVKIISGQKEKIIIDSKDISKLKIYQAKDEKRANLLLEKSY